MVVNVEHAEARRGRHEKLAEGDKQMIFGKPDSKGNSGTATEPAASAAPASAAAGQTERHAPALRYVDRPDTQETFADSVTGLIFDGQTLRIEFGVTRLDEVKPNTPISGRRYPACRVVLTTAAAVELINRMQQIATALTQAGVVKSAPRPSEPPHAG